MEEQVFISICIPAYKRVSYLQRLLDSIAIQTHRSFEIVITDDSPDLEVSDLIQNHTLSSRIRYFRNESALGTPENWNEGIRRANGRWIKIMHDDDWFTAPDSLQKYADAVLKYPETKFFFSAYTNVYLEKNSYRPVLISPGNLKALLRNPKMLLSKNVIGPPSVTFYKADPNLEYDASLKWLVDLDFYIRYLGNKKPVFIPDNLINVGMSSEQVTEQVFRNPSVEIPENIDVINKMGQHSLKDWIVYDAIWRFIRNLNIRSTEQFRKFSKNKQIPPVVDSMIQFQSAIPASILKTGPVSKILMFTHYLTQYSKLNRG